MSRLEPDLSDTSDILGSQSLDATTIPDDQKIAAQRTVAAYSTDAAECAEFLRMLGIYPGEKAAPEISTNVTGSSDDTRRRGSW